MSDDPLEALLEIGKREGALAGDSLGAFATALRDQARRIVEERVRPARERAAAFEKEAAWLRGLVENRDREIGSLRADKARCDEEAARARSDGRVAADAHDRLLAHHKAVLGQAAGTIEAAATALPWWRGAARRQLRDLARALKQEIG
jgi:hypothetical protein